jgi:hypothetical protein
MKATVAISLLGLAIASEAFGQAEKEQAMPDIYPLAEVKWKDGPVLTSCQREGDSTGRPLPYAPAAA